ncbi:hypothetical protein D3C80_1981910 [compost metagenome]
MALLSEEKKSDNYLLNACFLNANTDNLTLFFIVKLDCLVIFATEIIETIKNENDRRQINDFRCIDRNTKRKQK